MFNFMLYYAINKIQMKCVCYWPEKLHDSLTVENKFRVTFSSNIPFAEYEFRKFKLENVGSLSSHSFTHIRTHSLCVSLSLFCL